MAILRVVEKNHCRRGSYSICVDKLVDGRWRRLKQRRGTITTDLTYSTEDFAAVAHPPGPTCRIVRVSRDGKTCVLLGGSNAD